MRTDADWVQYIEALSGKYADLALLYAASENATGDTAAKLKQEYKDAAGDMMGPWYEGTAIRRWPMNHAFDYIARCMERLYQSPDCSPRALQYVIAGLLWDMLRRHGVEKCAPELRRLRSSKWFESTMKYLPEPERSAMMELLK